MLGLVGDLVGVGDLTRLGWSFCWVCIFGWIADLARLGRTFGWVGDLVRLDCNDWRLGLISLELTGDLVSF